MNGIGNWEFIVKLNSFHADFFSVSFTVSQLKHYKKYFFRNADCVGIRRSIKIVLFNNPVAAGRPYHQFLNTAFTLNGDFSAVGKYFVRDRFRGSFLLRRLFVLGKAIVA